MILGKIKFLIFKTELVNISVQNLEGENVNYKFAPTSSYCETYKGIEFILLMNHSLIEAMTRQYVRHKHKHIKLLNMSIGTWKKNGR